MEKLTNGFQKCEYEYFFKELKKMGLQVERHGGDYLKGNFASIRIDIKTDLNKKELEQKLKLILDHEIGSYLAGGKKEKYSGLKTYLLAFEVLIP